MKAQHVSSGGFAPRTPQQRLSLCNPFVRFLKRGADNCLSIVRTVTAPLFKNLMGSKGSALSAGPGGRVPWTYLLAFIAPLALASCGSPPPPPPVLTLNIVGSAGQNPDQNGHGTTVAVQLYQLAATGKFQSTDVYSLISKEAEVLGTDEMGSSVQYLVAPGQTLQETVPLKPMVTAVGLAVLFREINQSTWKLVAPVAPNGPSVVTLQINGLAATIAK